MKIFLFLLSMTSLFGSTVLTVDPDKRIKAKISKDSMNRIAFKGDRILNVFGDNDTYDIQTEETSGQIFIKPNTENGEKPLSITIMTESNVVQDLLLEPVQKEASTLIVMNRSKPKIENAATSIHQTFGFEHNQNPTCFKSSVLKTMKHLVLEQGESTEVLENEEKRPSTKDVTVKCYKAFSINGMRGVIYEVKNKGNQIADLKSEQFYMSGDLALSLQEDKLAKDQTTYLYAVRS